jgi:uncharacterized protein (TIGR00369 family)
MAELPPFDADRVRRSFAKQQVMATLGASLDRVAQGDVDISMPFSAAFTQQHGYLHAGIVATIADSACGYAAFSVMSEDSAVLSIEFKTNMLAPADGERIVARAKVTKSGRTIIVCDATVHASKNGTEKLVATMTGTMMAIKGRGITD